MMGALAAILGLGAGAGPPMPGLGPSGSGPKRHPDFCTHPPESIRRASPSTWRCKDCRRRFDADPRVRP